MFFITSTTGQLAGLAIAAVAGIVTGEFIGRLLVRRFRGWWLRWRCSREIAWRREWKVDRLLREHREAETLRKQNDDAEWERILAVFTEYDPPAA